MFPIIAVIIAVIIATIITFSGSIQLPGQKSIPEETQPVEKQELFEVRPQTIPQPVVKPVEEPKPVEKPIVEKPIKEELVLPEVSPYLDKVKISSVRAQSSSHYSLITLYTELEKDEEINITGLRIRGRTGSFIIPTGIEKYYPGYNPVPDTDIFAKQGDTIYLSGAPNPLGRGRNFKPNKCLGYLTNYYDFPVSFSRNCPKPTDEEISHLKPCCKIFIRNLGRCEAPDYSDNLSVSTDAECTAYLNNFFNYAACYRKYYRDENFLQNSWHIYMNTNFIVSDDCDTLYLRDQNGLLIDEYDYGYPVCR